MITKIITIIVALLLIGFLLLVNNTLNKPVYNKMYNVWEDDPESKKYSNITIILMLFIAFFIGLIF